MEKIFCMLSVLTLIGCGQSSSLDITVPESLDGKTKQVVIEAWPKVKKACVGLDRHAGAINFKGVQDNHSIDIIFEVREGQTSIPSRFMAAGQTCYLSVNHDGKQLSVAKEGCKAICLDRQIQEDDPANRGDLKLDL